MLLKVELGFQGNFLIEMKFELTHEGGIRNLQGMKGLEQGWVSGQKSVDKGQSVWVVIEMYENSKFRELQVILQSYISER